MRPKAHLLQLPKRLLLAALLCLVAPLAFGDGAHPAIWAVHGKYNTVYLVGTIHVLPDNETLPANIQQAYDDSNQLVMEIDTDNTDALSSQAMMMQLGLLPAGQTLQQRLGTATYNRLQSAARDVGIDASLMASFQPWLAALTLEQLELAKLGYSGAAGIEMQLTARAQSDQKAIRSLETVEEQLSLFAQLDNAAQRDYLLYTLDELQGMQAELDELLNAWRSGDETKLKALLQDGLKTNPKLFVALTTDRNRRWLASLKPLLNEDHDNYLVAVGALHLIGDDGVVALLRKAGYTVTRR